jgi:hypothetical protein
MLGANLGTIHDSMTSIQFEGIIKFRQPLLCVSIPRILNPTISLHQHCWSEVLIRIPPVGRTGSAAARAKDAFVHTVQFGPVLLRLEKLCLSLLLPLLALQPRFDGTILLVKVAHVRYKILDHVHMWEWVDLGGLPGGIPLALWLDVAETRESVCSINVHRAGSANALATGSAEGEGWILLIFDFEKCVEDHGSAVVEVDGVGG